ncbi:hypothetical protein JYU34_000839 [Plutella xylostella]|uniref:Secreted protein n=1 Tax=Plutella xylostella TaxID=51655 RepID=A0ABQ7R8Q7_PLUXY|nr:hypothetical protein JYU34_000839 [Plutella xylostella]
MCLGVAAVMAAGATARPPAAPTARPQHCASVFCEIVCVFLAHLYNFITNEYISHLMYLTYFYVYNYLSNRFVTATFRRCFYYAFTAEKPQVICSKRQISLRLFRRPACGCLHCTGYKIAGADRTGGGRTAR